MKTKLLIAMLCFICVSCTKREQSSTLLADTTTKVLATSSISQEEATVYEITFDGLITEGMESSVTAYGINHQTMKDLYWTFSDGWIPIVQGKDWTIIQAGSTPAGSDVEFCLSFTDASGQKQRVCGSLPCERRH